MVTSRRQFLNFAMLSGATVLALPLGASFSGALASSKATNPANNNNACHTLLSHQFRPLMGPTSRPLCDQFSNQVLLVVNTASKCGFTPQFEELELLHKKYSNRGFQVLGFPSGDFRQELSTEQEVAQFCELNYGVTFPMFEKVHVTGDKAHPFYQQLAQITGKYPEWNFNKYLIDRNGTPISHYNSAVMPMGRQLMADIEKLL